MTPDPDDAEHPKLPITEAGREDVPIWVEETPDKNELFPLGKKIPALLEPSKALTVTELKGYIVVYEADLPANGLYWALTFDP